MAVLAVLLFLVPTVQARRAVYAPAATATAVDIIPTLLDGSLSTLSSAYSPAGTASVAITPDGAHLYAGYANQAFIGSYNVVASSGALLRNTPVPTSGTPLALAISPSGAMLYAALSSGAVTGFEIGSDGSLTALAGATASLSGGPPVGLAISPDGSRIYASHVDATGNGRIVELAVGAGGALSTFGDVAAGTSPQGISMTPSGRALYAADAGGGGAVLGYTLGASGELIAMTASPFAAGAGTRSLAVSSDGAHLIAANAVAGSVSAFVIGADGSLSPSDSTNSIAGASSVAVSPNSTTVYVGGTGVVGAFALSAAGKLVTRGGSVATDGQHLSVVVAPDQAPLSQLTVTPAPAGSPSTFDGRSSMDSDGTVSSWSWDFGDGAKAAGPSVQHSFVQAGTYDVTLTTTDDEGCSTSSLFTGQTMSCRGGQVLHKLITIVPPGLPPNSVQPCAHVGNDGFCGTPDLKAPTVTVLGFNDGASISTLDAPQEIVGAVTPDPSGIKEIRLRFTKAAGTAVKKTVLSKTSCRTTNGTRRCRRVPVYKTTCRRVSGKRRCQQRKVVRVVDSKVPVCLTISGTKTYFIKYLCSNVPWITIPGDTTFRFPIPEALTVGSYTVDVLAEDGAGNTDTLEQGRNHVRFKVVNAPSNQDSGGTGTSGVDTGTAPSMPITDTGSPFGR